MAAIVFDIRKAERRLKAAGASDELAEATADLMSEAVLLNLDALVTKDYLDARIAELDARLDMRFGEMEARFNERILQVDSRLDARLGEIEARFNARFLQSDGRIAGLDARLDKQHAELTGQFRLVYALLALLLAGVFIPQLQAWFSG